MNRSEKLQHALRSAGYRMTPQRLAICDVLAASDDHPTPYVVYERVRVQVPTVSVATVYNTLGALRDLGAIVEIGLGRSEAHYEPNLAPHANLICLQCGRISDFEGCRCCRWHRRSRRPAASTSRTPASTCTGVPGVPGRWVKGKARK
ncbi:MAG: transcriptional repressor [Caldilineae bacterium]|nr:transcriptional repressor [Caldilineae bacterium]